MSGTYQEDRLLLCWRGHCPHSIFDVVVDLGMLTQIIPDINARFGLAPEHISVYDPETKKVHWDELRKRGFELSGFVVARTAMKKHLMVFSPRLPPNR